MPVEHRRGVTDAKEHSHELNLLGTRARRVAVCLVCRSRLGQQLGLEAGDRVGGV
jgi:hypothetical protein